jgi:hypothetical protein
LIPFRNRVSEMDRLHSANVSNQMRESSGSARNEDALRF